MRNLNYLRERKSAVSCLFPRMRKLSRPHGEDGRMAEMRRTFPTLGGERIAPASLQARLSDDRVGRRWRVATARYRAPHECLGNGRVPAHRDESAADRGRLAHIPGCRSGCRGLGAGRHSERFSRTERRRIALRGCRSNNVRRAASAAPRHRTWCRLSDAADHATCASGRRPRIRSAR